MMVLQAAMGMESKEDWAEIMDSRLNGNCNLQELGDMANIAYKCVLPERRRRPKMRTVAQNLFKLGKKRTGDFDVNHGMPVIKEHLPEAQEFSQRQWSKPTLNGNRAMNGSGVEMV